MESNEYGFGEFGANEVAKPQHVFDDLVDGSIPSRAEEATAAGRAQAAERKRIRELRPLAGPPEVSQEETVYEDQTAPLPKPVDVQAHVGPIRENLAAQREDAAVAELRRQLVDMHGMKPEDIDDDALRRRVQEREQGTQR